jgi:hypothetical protein
MKTIGEIQEEFASKSGEILNGHLDDVSRIKARSELTDGAYLDRLSPEQRMSVLREEKAEEARGVSEKAREAYAQEVESYLQDIAKRALYLRERLFEVEDAGALSRAALATDAELSTLMNIAAKAGNRELGKAVFAVAEGRGMGDLMMAYYRLDPEAEELYAEYTSIPSEEILECRANSAEALIPDPDPDSLVSYATAAT